MKHIDNQTQFTESTKPNIALSFLAPKHYLQKQISCFNQISNCIFKRIKCQCQNISKFQSCRQSLSWLFKIFKKQDLPKLQKYYNQKKKQPFYNQIIYKNIRQQIQILNLYKPKYFYNNSQAQQQLENLLLTFAKHNKIKQRPIYLKGFQWIAAAFLYHSQQYIAFWLMQIIFEQLKLFQIYNNQITNHIQKILQYIATYSKSTMQFINKLQINIKPIIDKFIRQLMCNYIPIELQGWHSFYIMSSAYLQVKCEIAYNENKGQKQLNHWFISNKGVEWPVIYYSTNFYRQNPPLN